MNIFIGTVALEVNRWSSRIPSFTVSDWIERMRDDGFDGLELWENHVMLHNSPEEEIKKILASEFPVDVYNSYIGFEDENAFQRSKAVEMICTLKAKAVKYNVGSDIGKLAEYKSNLLEFAGNLPDGCRLLCELHDGTVLEDDAVAIDFFNDLPKKQFGIILQPFGDPELFKKKFDVFGNRISNIHSQLLNRDNARVRLDRMRTGVCDCFKVMKENGFNGDVTIEFTEGTAAPGENIEDLYKNAVLDMEFIRENY